MLLSIDGITLQTVVSNITRDIVHWEPKSVDATGQGTTLRIFDPLGKPKSRYHSGIISVIPNSMITIDIDSLNNKKFMWCYYLVQEPKVGAKVLNPNINWMSQNHVSINVGKATGIIILVGNNDGFPSPNSWKVALNYKANLVVGGGKTTA